MSKAPGLKFQGLGASGLEVQRVHLHLKSSKPQKPNQERRMVEDYSFYDLLSSLLFPADCSVDLSFNRSELTLRVQGPK